MVAACSASSTGLCQGSTMTAVPSRSVVVLAATQVSRLRLAETWPKPVKWCSTTKVLAKPRLSASTLYSTKSLKPCPLSTSGPPRFACALPNSPNCMGRPPLHLAQHAPHMSTLQDRGLLEPDCARGHHGGDPCCPSHLHVLYRLARLRDQIEMPFSRAGLDLAQQHAAVLEGDHAEIAEEIVGRGVARLVVKDHPAVEIGPQTRVLDLEDLRDVGRDFGHLGLVQVALRDGVVVRLAARADIAHDRHGRLFRRLVVRERKILGGDAPPREQPFRAHSETAAIAFGLLRPVIASARQFGALMRAVGGDRHVQGEGGSPPGPKSF